MSDSTVQNPYAVPASNLQDPVANSALGIEEALQRGYDFSIGAVISEAWQKVKGAKGIIIGGFVIYYIIILLATTVLGFVTGLIGLGNPEDGMAALIIGQLLVGIIGSALSYPFLAGVMLVGIHRADDQPISFASIFGHFSLLGPLIITALIMMTFVYLGMLLLIIPGIYLSVAYMLAIPLVIERGLSPWQALEVSRQAIGQHWFKVFGLFLVMGLIVLISVIPLGIGLIWSIPLFTIVTGVLYRTIFGVLPAGSRIPR